MWCSSCQQDVPGVAAMDDATVRCARCQQTLATRSTREPTHSAPERVVELAGEDWFHNQPAIAWDDWELDDDLRDADQIVKALGVRRHDHGHATTGMPHLGSVAARSTSPSKVQHGAFKRISSLFSWSMLSIGVMGFVFGGVLLGWSFWGDRPDLWRLGLPFALAGQVALVIGLVFQLDGLWRSNQQASRTLDDLDDQLDELRRATTLLGTAHSNSARSFYAHMADGAGPQLLLADLKGQLDLLAMKMSNDRG